MVFLAKVLAVVKANKSGFKVITRRYIILRFGVRCRAFYVGISVRDNRTRSFSSSWGLICNA